MQEEPAACCVQVPAACLCPRPCRAKRDLNRDFPDRFASPSMFASGLEQPETAAVMAWSLSKGFVASASFHEV